MGVVLRGAGLLLAGLFCSGAGALTFEALWFYQAGLAFGHGVLASALVLSGFMAGMASGTALAARFGDRLDRPVRAYAALELAVGVTGAVLVYVLPNLSRMLAPLAIALEGQPLWLSGLRLTVAWLLLLLPSAAMGMTLPLVVRGLTARKVQFGGALGWLYGVHTLGGVVGVLVSECVLLEPMGVYGSAWVACGLCVVAASCAFLASRAPAAPQGAAAADAATPRQDAVQKRPATGEAASAPKLPRPGPLPTNLWPWLATAFASGFAMLGLQVAWLRFLLLFLTDTPLAFAGVLALVVLGIAVGGLVAGAWLSRQPGAHRHAGTVALGAAIAGLLGLRAYPAALAHEFRLEQDLQTIFSLGAPLILGTALGSGVLFTLLGAGLRARLPGDARTTGRLVLINTIGAASGAGLTGLWLLPTFGMEACLLGLLSLYSALGLLLIVVLRKQVQPIVAGLAALTCVALTVAYPLGDVHRRYVHGSVSRWMGPEDKVVTIREDQTGTLIHVQHRWAGLSLFDQLATNSYSMATNDFAARRYMKLHAILPMALHPGMESALLVGFGVGNTAAELTSRPELTRIDVVDISRDTLELSEGMRFGEQGHPLHDDRVHVHIEDGRHYLYGTGRRYDLITGEPPPPILAGVNSLYSEEYFQLLHSRLKPGGFVSYWLPMMNLSAPAGRSIIAGFCAAFADCTLWHGSAENFMLMGTRAASGPVALGRYLEAFRSPQARAELSAIGFDHPAQLAALFIGDAEYLRALVAQDPATSDAYPRRIQREGGAAERNALLDRLRDTRAAAKRFMESRWTAEHFPARVHADAPKHFENQRLLNDLLFYGPSAARTPAVLLQVVTQTPLVLPVLLLMGSDPEIQRELERHPEGRDPRLQAHRAAGHLARRELGAALSLLERLPAQLQPLPGLTEWLRHGPPRAARSQAPPASR